jgi:hypothetical protein
MLRLILATDPTPHNGLTSLTIATIEDETMQAELSGVGDARGGTKGHYWESRGTGPTYAHALADLLLTRWQEDAGDV